MTAVTELIERLNVDADRLKLSNRADLHAVCGDVREAATTLASLKEENDRFAERIAALEIASNGALERCALLLSAKNHWMDRATAAESANEALRVALERIKALTPAAANAATARDLHLTVSAIAAAALSSKQGGGE